MFFFFFFFFLLELVVYINTSGRPSRRERSECRDSDKLLFFLLVFII
jgi:hypothetical protein